MKARYKTFGGRIEFEVEGGNEKEVFKQLAKLEEVFKGEPCGLCKKNNISLRVRNVEENDFFELHCNDCNACLGFGQHKKGNTLFPKRKNAEGVWLPANGWAKWDGKKKE